MLDNLVGIQRQRQQRAFILQLIETSSAVRFGGIAGPVVQIQTDEREGDTGGLDGSGVVPEPDDSDDDDEDAFDERGDGVGDGGNHGQQHEGYDVLSEVEDAVEDELDGQSAVVQRVVFVR